MIYSSLSLSINKASSWNAWDMDYGTGLMLVPLSERGLAEVKLFAKEGIQSQANPSAWFLLHATISLLAFPSCDTNRVALNRIPGQGLALWHSRLSLYLQHWHPIHTLAALLPYGLRK